MSVLIAQCLCPQRHCVVAVTSDEMSAEQLTQTLRSGVAEGIKSRVLSPWCGLCGADAETWNYECAAMRNATSLDEALPLIREVERQNLASRELMDDLGVSYDSKRGERN